MSITARLILPTALAGGLSILVASVWLAGKARGERACRAELAQVAVSSADEHARQVQALRRAERDLRNRLDLQTFEHQQEMNRLEQSRQDLAARLRAGGAGALRVSIPVAPSTAVPACTAGAGSAAAAGDRTTRAELAPETALDLDDIAADGDAAILDLNRCIAAYDSVTKVMSNLAERAGASLN